MEDLLREFRTVVDSQIILVVDAELIRGLGAGLTYRLREWVGVFVSRQIIPSRVRFEGDVPWVLAMIVVERRVIYGLFGLADLHVLGRPGSIF